MIDKIKELIEYLIANNNLYSIVEGILIFITILLSLHLAKLLFYKFAQKKFEESSKIKLITKKLDNISKSINKFDYIFLPTIIFLNSINFPENISNFLSIIGLAVFIFYTTRIIQIIINYFFQNIALKQEAKDKNYDASPLKLFQVVINLILWLIGILFFISNLGYNITSLIAGLGVSGIVVAFALQNVLADIFAYFSIYIDRPFKVGDFIIVGNDLGTVKKIGIKNTKIDHLNGQQLSIPNRTLTENNVNNYTVMQRRRIKFLIGVVYETPTKKLEKGVEIIKKIITDVEGVTLDRVHFKEFAAFSLNYEIIYFVESKDYNIYMDLNEKIQFEIKKQFEKQKISIAFPTQTIKLEK